MRSTSMRLTILAAAILSTTTAFAERSFLLAEQNQALQSSFTLDFGPEFGGPATTNITTTTYTLEVNEAAGAARFIDYYQTAEPLTLPGGANTGDLTITIVPGSSHGTYLPDGAFATSELYAIAFTGDLSLYGLTSPVYLPGDSSGVVSNGDNSISSLWDGQGQLPNPFDPGNFITFTYRCEVHTVFAPQTPCDGDIDGDGLITQSDLGALLASYGASTGDAAFNPLADFNSDGSVNQDDLGVLLAGFGTACE